MIRSDIVSFNNDDAFDNVDAFGNVGVSNTNSQSTSVLPKT